jgi:membrane-associated phospholipid phosphatase
VNHTDKLLATYLVFVTVVLVARGGVGEATVWLLLAHALFGVLMLLVSRLTPTDRVGNMIHDLYPLVVMLGLYAEIGTLTVPLGLDTTFENDAIVQQWEAALFGSQVSYEWIRRAPSIFWSGVLHLVYFVYYPMVVLGPVLLAARGKREQARRVLFTTMLAFVTCYVVFVLFPVAGPNYAFEHPTGPVREVWSARLVYGVLQSGSSFGAAFPSSHIAGAVAATLAVWREWRLLAYTFVLPVLLLLIGIVYCQMHYAVDVLAGLVVAGAATLAAGRVFAAKMNGRPSRVKP